MASKLPDINNKKIKGMSGTEKEVKDCNVKSEDEISVILTKQRKRPQILRPGKKCPSFFSRMTEEDISS